MQISKENLPRERMESQGSQALSDSELLAILLKTGTKGENILSLSQKLVAFGLSELGKQSLNELQKFRGVGKAKASQILALFELIKRYQISKTFGKPITCAKDVFNYCKPLVSEKDREVFLALYLDTKNKVIKHEVISIGTLNSSLVHPREVFKSAIKESASSIIFVHNHPSGDVTPSKEDKTITNTLFKAGEFLSINVLDHVIIGRDEWFSFKDG